MSYESEQSLAPYFILAGLFIALVAFMIFSPFTLINVGHRGVVSNLGHVKDEVLTEGFHFISPFDSVQEIDVRTTKVEADVSAASKDLQAISATVAVNYNVNPSLVKGLYQDTAGRFEETLIAPAIQESVKAATAAFTAEELVTKRSEIKDSVLTTLRSRENLRYFNIQDVSIVNFDFSDSFNEAIERKVTAEQEALASKNKLEQTKYEAEQKIVRAQADAESIRIQAEAVQNQGGKEYIDLVIANKWNGVLPTYMMGDAVPFVNLK